MKIEIIMESFFLLKILSTLKKAQALNNVTISFTEVRQHGNHTCNKKVLLKTECSETQKEHIVQELFPLVHEHGGICIASNC